MNIYILYSQFTNDPSEFRGAFTTRELAEEKREEWKKEDRTIGVYSDIVEIEINKVYEDFYLS